MWFFKKKQLSTKQVLEQALKLIEPEGSWIKGTHAQDADGNWVAITSKRACKFCVSGAIRRVYYLATMSRDVDYTPAEIALQDVVRSLFNTRNIAMWNDAPTTTHKDVQAILQYAINQAA